MSKRLGFVLVGLAAAFPLAAGDFENLSRRCATKDHDEKEREQVSQENSRFKKALAASGQEVERAPGSVTVPVYFHVIRSGSGAGDVTDSEINAQIDVLNDAYSGQVGGGANTPFRFTLVGVDRTNNEAWYTMGFGSQEEKAAKAALRKGGAETLNIYTANLGGGLLGWATFPSDYRKHPSQDGVVILYRVRARRISRTLQPGRHRDPRGWPLGRPVPHVPGRLPGAERPGRRHACRAVAGLRVPLGARHLQRTPGLDPIENFMDYTDDACMFEFTAGQSVRADGLTLQYR